MTGPGTLEYATETRDMATANHRLALSNFDNIWPWRYLRWRRVNREVHRVRDEIQHRRDLHADAMGWEREAAA